MPLYPLFADLAGREVLVVGGGEVALRKIEALLHAGARVRVHALELHAALATLEADGRLERLAGGFDPDWIDAAWLVVVATDDAALNAAIAAHLYVSRRTVETHVGRLYAKLGVTTRVELAKLATTAIDSTPSDGG